jgi:predicted nucleic acid-binding Zn ribbon protein
MRSNERPLGDVIREVLRKYRLQDHLEETRIAELWPKICGRMIALHTLSVSVHGKVLFVKLDSGALRQELGYRKKKLLGMINSAAGHEAIEDIVFS